MCGGMCDLEICRKADGCSGTTSDYRSLDVRRLHRDGLLAPG
jgi:hypothetical protein